MKYSVSKGPLLSSTHAVTTSARPGDTPWVNKWGACQSAHHNSSETVVCREDLAMLGFGFFQLCCCSYSPSQITLSPSATWTWGREWPLLCGVVFCALRANLFSQFVSDHVASGLLWWWFFGLRYKGVSMSGETNHLIIQPCAWRPPK